MSRVVLGVAGGIAAYKAASLLRLLTESGHDVTVVPTEAALRFVGAPTWSALSGHPVHAQVWDDVHEVPHVRLGQDADLVVVAPATADLLARGLLRVVGDLSPYLLLVAIFVVTAGLGQVVSNTATALIVVPIAVAAATAAGVAVEPVLMTVAVAGAASFLTPIATPANMMVMGPGGYRFGDYWRLGVVTLLAWLAVALAVIPLVWPLR